MYNPQFKATIKMVQDMWNTHQGDANYITLDWGVRDLYDPRYPNQMIQQIVPLLVIDFK